MLAKVNVFVWRTRPVSKPNQRQNVLVVIDQQTVSACGLVVGGGVFPVCGSSVCDNFDIHRDELVLQVRGAAAR